VGGRSGQDVVAIGGDAEPVEREQQMVGEHGAQPAAELPGADYVRLNRPQLFVGVDRAGLGARSVLVSSDRTLVGRSWWEHFRGPEVRKVFAVETSRRVGGGSAQEVADQVEDGVGLVGGDDMASAGDLDVAGVRDQRGRAGDRVPRDQRSCAPRISSVLARSPGSRERRSVRMLQGP
jgi:hypothetical protein